MKRQKGEPIWLGLCRDPLALVFVLVAMAGMGWSVVALALRVLW